MSKSHLIRLLLVAGVGLSAVGLVLGLLLLIAPPAQAQNPSPAHPEAIASLSSERLGAVHPADAPAVPQSPDDYPPCELYVSDDGDDSYGCSFDNRCRSIQRALEVATNPGTVICVAGGDYAWSEVPNHGNNGLVDIEEAVVILGGWNDTFDTRDPALYPSLLDAERQERVLYVDGTITVTIDGFEIISGYRDTAGGGGIYVRYAEATIANCLITNNVLSRSLGSLNGAGIYFNFASGSQVLSSTIRDNATYAPTGRGGGIYATSSDDLVLRNSDVISNVALGGGGGLYLYGCHTPTLQSLLIANNQTDGDRGGLYLDGDLATLDHVVVDHNTAVGAEGGFYIEGITATLSHVTVTNNIVISGGEAGGGYVNGDYATLSNMLVQNNQNTDPSADYGGLGVEGDYVNLSHVLVLDNRVGDDHGGLYVSGSWARLTNITATNNIAYGQSSNRGAAGIFVSNNPVTLTRVLVENNVGLGTGSDANAGGLYLQSGNSSFLQDVTVISNSSSYRYSGLYVYGDDVTLDQVTVYSNTAQDAYAGLYLSGDDSVLSDLSVLSNTAGVQHAGVYVTGRRTLLDRFEVQHNRVLTTVDCLGGGIYLNANNSILQDGLVSDNRGCYGGGIYLDNGPYTLTHTFVTDNYASQDGGGVYLENQGLVKSCYVAGNQAETGGGVYMTSGFGYYYTLVNSFIANNQANVAGDGLYADQLGFLFNNTFVNNHDEAVFYDASSTFNLSVTNNIIVSHAIGFESAGDGYIVNDYTLFDGNVENYSGTVENGFHNIGGDPAFYDPNQGDYHITQDSVAINAGTTIPWLTDDYDGEPRPNGSAYDIGADESYEQPVQGAYFTYTPPEPILGQPLRFTGNVLTGTPPITYAWDFGDGSGAEGRYPLHLYAEPGPYTVVMTVSNVANEGYHQAFYSETINVIVRSLLLEPDWVTVTAEGQILHFAHSLTNTGSVSDSYSLQASSPQGWPVSSTTQVGTLLPGEGTTIWVTLTVPWGSGGQVGQAIITATSDVAPVIYDTATDQAIVASSNAQPGVDIGPQRSGAAFAGQTLLYQHVLTNTGSGPDYLQFQTQSALPWTVTLSPSQGVQVNSGQTATLQARVSIPAGASPHQTNVTTITATSLVSPAVSASITDTSTVLEILPAVLLEPDYSWVALESGPVQFTHTLTNTGNYSDSFTLTATSSAGWPLAWTETPTGSLAAGRAKTVLITITVPDGVVGVVNTTVITATSQLDDGVYDTATDEIVVPGELRQPGIALSPGDERSAYAGQTIAYQHTLTNTGDGPDRFSLEANSSQAWPLALNLTSLVVDSGQTATLRLSLTLPADAPAGQVDLTTLTATSAFSPAVFASAVNTSTVVIIPRGVRLEPDHTIVAMEGDQLNFNHILTNTGITTDSFDLALGASENWPVSWTPGPIGPLAAEEWALVRVTVTVPSGSAGQINQIVLTATSQADGQTHDTATEVVAALSDNPQPGVSLTPDRSGSVWSGGVIVYQHTITNTGNGADYFGLQAVSSLGWNVVLTPALGILLDSGESDTISLHLMAPADAAPGQIDVTTLTATSLLAPAVSASVRDETEVLGEPGHWIYLPIVLKGG